MSAPDLNLAARAGSALDRKVQHKRWSPSAWPLGASLELGVGALVPVVLVVLELIAGSAERTLRVPIDQLSFAKVEQGVFHDLIPLRANVVPRETIYIDAIDGGRVDRVFVEAGDLVQEGQPIIELSNTN